MLWPLLRAQLGSGGCSLPWVWVSSSDWCLKLPCAASEPTATSPRQKLGHVTGNLSRPRARRIWWWSIAPGSSKLFLTAACTPQQGWPWFVLGSCCPCPTARLCSSQDRLWRVPAFSGTAQLWSAIYTRPCVQLYSQKSSRMKTTDSQPNPSWGSLSIHQAGLLPGTIPHRWAVNEVTQIIHAQLGSPLQLWLLNSNYIYNPMTGVYMGRFSDPRQSHSTHKVNHEHLATDW